MTVNRPTAMMLRANQETPMKTFALATVSALAIAFAAPALAMDCAGKKALQSAEAAAAPAETPAESAAVATPAPVGDAPQAAEVAAAPAPDTATAKN